VNEPFDPLAAALAFAAALEARAVDHAIGGAQDAWFLSAEGIASFKLLFFRGKDRVEVDAVVARHPA
jgi:hypothetical protein